MSLAPSQCLYCEGKAPQVMMCGFCDNGVPLDTQADWDNSWGKVLEYVKGQYTAQVNDLVGGYIVTTYPHPLSEHDKRIDGDVNKRGYVIAECVTYEDADLIATLLNNNRPQSLEESKARVRGMHE